MRKKLTPARVVAPGKILLRELEARGWTQTDLATIINRPVQTINEIVNEKKKITPETALEFAEAFGTSAEFWNNLEANYRLHLAKKEKDESEIKRRSQLYSVAPVSELIKREWIDSTDSTDELDRSVCQFLEIESLDEPPKLAVNFRYSPQQQPEINAQIAWLKRVEHLSKCQDVQKFKMKELKKSIPSLLSYAENPEQIQEIPSFFLNLGVHFVIVPHLNKTYLDGAAFYLNEHPVIALTLRYDRIDAFWFTLMHELAHIVMGHNGLYLDNLQKLEENQWETEANQVAKNWLISLEDLKIFINRTQPKFSSKAIIAFAQSQKRHPGIILGRLQHEGLVPYKNLKKFLVKVKPFLEGWIDR